MFVGINAAASVGSAGIRAYTGATDPQATDLTLVNTGNTGIDDLRSQAFNTVDFAANVTEQVGVDPIVDYGGSQITAQAHTNPNLYHQRWSKFEYASHCNAPDFGQLWLEYCRTGTNGNFLGIQSYYDSIQTLTVPLTPYEISGQPIIRTCMTWEKILPITVIAAGTAADTHTYQDGEFCGYVFPVNEAIELATPHIALRLADVPTATDILAQCSYSPLSFTSPAVASQTFYQTFDLGSGSGTIPMDRNIGPIYCRFPYLNSPGAVLRPGYVQTF